jgi:hypothetical protein
MHIVLASILPALMHLLPTCRLQCVCNLAFVVTPWKLIVVAILHFMLGMGSLHIACVLRIITWLKRFDVVSAGTYWQCVDINL